MNNFIVFENTEGRRNGVTERRDQLRWDPFLLPDAQLEDFSEAGLHFLHADIRFATNFKVPVEGYDVVVSPELAEVLNVPRNSALGTKLVWLSDSGAFQCHYGF